MLTTTASQPIRSPLHISPDPAAFRDLFSDSRFHGPQGPNRTVRFPRVTSSGGGTICKSEDNLRCVVAGRESLRILRISDSPHGRDAQPDNRSVVGVGGTRIEGSRNFWEGSGLKIDNANTDVVWAHGTFANKILTSARNGELILWDLNKSGASKYERRTRDHTRSINKLSYSKVVQHYCLSGSADGDVRIWDLRDMSKSVLKIHHPTGVRTLAFSPNQSNPLHTVVCLDNGSIYRWDLKMGQRGQLDRLPVAHTGPILAVDWFASGQDRESLPSVSSEGWVATGGMDRCVKIWDFNSSASSNYQPVYTLHTSFEVRRVLWRPSHECELAVVSGADFGTGSSSDIGGSKMPSPRITERPISGDSSAMGSLDELRLHLYQRLRDEMPSSVHAPQNNGLGDSIEIWDVRRQYIAKWSVQESALEGGVTDVAFGDQYLLWTQHSSGTFSQLDVRNSWRPLDAVSSSALTWDVSGSLAFVSDNPLTSQIPYDDVDLGRKQLVQDFKMRIKGLGDAVYLPQSQGFATYTHDWAAEDTEGFVKLARGYMLHGTDRPSICRFNASVAFDAGQAAAAQTWSLLESLLTDVIPAPTPAPSPFPIANPVLPHSISTPTVLPSMHSSPSPRTDQNKTPLSESGISHSRSSRHDGARGAGTTPHDWLTPTSSVASSPQRSSLNLPPLANTPFPSSLFARRQSNAGVSPNTSSSGHRNRPSSSLQRPSVSSDALSGLVSIRNHAASLKHVGEGALDDSDSSGDEGHDRSSLDEDAEEEQPFLRPLISPYLFPRSTTVQPSPLSRMMKQQDWLSLDADEGDEDGSPVPSSSDSDQSTSESSKSRNDRRRKLNGSRSTKSRSRSSTVASLAAPSTASLGLLSARKPIIKQPSQSSIRTVIAGDPSIKETDTPWLHQEETTETMRDSNNYEELEDSSVSGHKRKISEAVCSDFVPDDGQVGEQYNEAGQQVEKFTNRRRKDAIEKAERKYRNLGWNSLQEAFELFAEEGDVQMCATLAMIAPSELQISSWRALRFLESYIEILSRLRLHTSAAYVRKYAESEDIRAAATLHTTIHTSCGRCRKPILIPSGLRRQGKASGGFSYCLQCQTRVAKCSVCHLPAKALLFHCAVCMHGGHQSCYRKYYAERPMVELTSLSASLTPAASENAEYREEELSSPSTAATAAGSYGTSASGGGGSDYLHQPPRDKMLGHPCAAGCGHYCWAVRERHHPQFP